MVKYIINDSLDGIFTAVYDSFLYKDQVTDILISQEAVDFLSVYKKIENSESKINKVKSKLKVLLCSSNYEKISVAFHSSNEKKHLIIFNYLVKIIKCNKDCSTNFSEQDVFVYNNMLHKIYCECHRFKGFIRFEKSSCGIYIAKFSPDNDITSLIFPHFKRRFKNNPFILHDEKRNLLALSNKEKSLITFGNTDFFALGVDNEIKKLFKLYYDTVNIACRKNTRLMLNFLPKRYHKNLPEKDELL